MFYLYIINKIPLKNFGVLNGKIFALKLKPFSIYYLHFSFLIFHLLSIIFYLPCVHGERDITMVFGTIIEGSNPSGRTKNNKILPIL